MRTYFAWVMLFAAMTFAVPRAWIHNCIGEHASHQVDDGQDQSDSVDHGSCAACAFSLSSTVQSSSPIYFAAPRHKALSQLEPISILAENSLLGNNLRGPPFA